MADTGIIGPLSNSTIGTALGDGNTYTAWSTAIRLHRDQTGASAAVATVANQGTLWYNCFNSTQIPLGATITGVEIVATTDFDGSGDSNIGTFGTTGTTSSITFRAYLYNGSSYSSPLAYDGVARTGITYSDSDTSATFLGANRRYLGLTTLGTLFGAPDSLSGLTWDPADQASFGFAFTSTAIVGSPVAGALRGIGLRVTYTEGLPVKLINFSESQVVEVDGVTGGSMAQWGAISFTPSDPPVTTWSSSLYSYETQTTQENAASSWTVSGDMSTDGWVNGTSAVNGTYWGLTTNKTVKGWNLGQDTTTSTSTGPNGGATLPNGTPSLLTGEDKYMYTEVSSGYSSRCFVCRTGGYNFSTLMDSTSNNLDLEFWVHGYGNQMGDLYVYIDTATTSNNTNATQLTSITSFSQTSINDPYTKVTVSLNSYRTVNNTHYIYFVSQNASGFNGDLAVDLVQFKESEP